MSETKAPNEPTNATESSENEQPPGSRQVNINGPVSLEFVDQLIQVFPPMLPSVEQTEREIFLESGRQQVVMLVCQAAQMQAQHRAKHQAQVMQDLADSATEEPEMDEKHE
jgi:hypothetical protein